MPIAQCICQGRDFSYFAWLSTILLMSMLGTARASEPFFLSCDPALDTPPFKRLRDFYAGHPDQPKPEACFRLNNREFLVTVTNTGRVGQGLYYFNADTGTYDFPDGSYRANIQVMREFVGPNKKRFVILTSSNLNEGIWDIGYELLFLKPTENGRSFEIQELLFANQDPENGMCGTHIKKGTATDVKDVLVEHEGTTEASLVFVVDSKVCPKGKRHNHKRRFIWSSGRFREAGKTPPN